MPEALSPDIVAFVTAHVRTLDGLQVLICCLEHQERWWDGPTMAREVGISESSARRSLDHLARGNLLDIRVTADVRYLFAPGTERLRAIALACLTSYRTNPMPLVQLVTRSAAGRARDFADAFRLRDRDDG